MTEPTDIVATLLDEARCDLLDLGLRNTLLNFRLTKRRGVEVVGEDSSAIFEALVGGQKTLTFTPAVEEPPSTPSSSTDSTAFAEPEPEQRSKKALQTALTSTELRRRLLATFYDARSSIDETGVNTLYLALGMLTWYEDDSSDEPRRAPLVLVPVVLERGSVEKPFEMSWTGDDVGANLSLAMKLKADFGVAVPQLPPADALDDISDYLDRFADAVQPMKRWSVDPDAIALGFFSFAKFLMFNDLDASCWSPTAKPYEHPDIVALLRDGFGDGEPLISDAEHLDQYLAPADTYHVVDADSTQTLALLDAATGRSMVIQGPPGTGKSQTITNLVAEAVAGGKSVLFVSEKMAALEVVKRNLDRIGLGDACLELHSNKTNKKAVLDELRRTLELGRPKTQQAEADLALLGEQRARLNAYCDAVNLPVASSGVTPHAAMGEVLLCREQLSLLPDVPSLRVEGMLKWDATLFMRRCVAVEELQARLHAIGDSPQDNPFWLSAKTVFLPGERDEVLNTLASATKALVNLADSQAELAGLLRIDAFADRQTGSRIASFAEHVAVAPDLEGTSVCAAEWTQSLNQIQRAVQAGRHAAETHGMLDSLLVPEAWDNTLLGVREQLAKHESHWYRFAVPEYRTAMARVAGLTRAGKTPSAASALEIVDQIHSEQEERSLVKSASVVAGRALGQKWREVSTDWAWADAAVQWVTTLYAGVASAGYPRDAVERSSGLVGTVIPAELLAVAEAVRQGITEHCCSMDAVLGALQLDEHAFMGSEATLLDSEYEAQLRWCGTWASRIDELQQVVALNIGVLEVSGVGLAPVAEAARTWAHAGVGLLAAFRKSYFESLLDNAFSGRPELATFDAAAQERLLGSFQELDKTVLRHNRARVLLSHWERLPKGNGQGQLGTLRHEFEKRRRHKPVRRLIEEAGFAIQAIKPVFMMSPLSVATYLPPEAVQFDLVVFDEASQVRPVDSFGAIIRGKQTVVVGDSRQLPPSAFFDNAADGGDDDGLATADIESVLGLFEGQGAHTRMLRWHYRSRHESLIAVSNREFYDNRLVVFPSPLPRSENLGLVFHHLPNTAWERGNRTPTNPLEAQAVAEAVMAHAKRCPEKTLGVAAFSKNQAEAIQDRLETLRRSDPTCETFFGNHPEEPFFIKNLENVQGDERAVIFISVGYGRTSEGYLAKQFGPVSAEGGWRRLNVLITRARERCEVFSNLTADDIVLARTDARGVRALKSFLKYAQHGILDIAVVTGAEPDSPFEEDVAGWLRRNGYDVECQVGSGGFLIDLAVRDSAQPGRYVLGIECDGATYHSARSARDRDRLRQAVLENLGWRIHRIWSTDWFRDPDRQFRLLVEALEAARVSLPRESDTELVRVQEPQETSRPEREQRVVPKRDAPVSFPYIRYMPGPVRTRLIPCSINLNVERLMDVVTTEGPIHLGLAARRWGEAVGRQRVSRNMYVQFLDLVVDDAKRRGIIEVRGDFIWLPKTMAVRIRDRSSLDQQDRKVDFIAPEEIAEALLCSVAAGIGLTDDEAIAEASRLFGFGRTGADIRSAIEATLRQMLSSGAVCRRGSHIVMPDDSN